MIQIHHYAGNGGAASLLSCEFPMGGRHEGAAVQGPCEHVRACGQGQFPRLSVELELPAHKEHAHGRDDERHGNRRPSVEQSVAVPGGQGCIHGDGGKGLQGKMPDPGSARYRFLSPHV